MPELTKRERMKMDRAVMPMRDASDFHILAKWPVSNINTLSPGDSELTNAASQAPVPDDG